MKVFIFQFQTNKKEREIWEFEMDDIMMTLFIGGQV